MDEIKIGRVEHSPDYITDKPITLKLDRSVTAEGPTRNRVFVSDDRCTLVNMWPDGTVTVATRNHPAETWGPPVYLKEEK